MSHFPVRPRLSSSRLMAVAGTLAALCLLSPTQTRTAQAQTAQARTAQAQTAQAQTAQAQTAQAQPAVAPAPKSFPLLQTETNSNGTPIVYPKGAPQITARITEIPPGARTGVHTHQIPLFVYILGGTLTIRGENGESAVYKEGDAYMERTDWHEGINEGSQTVRLLAVYPGEVGTPLSVKRTN